MILEYKGTPVFYTDEGKGAVVVLLHGFLESSYIWADIKTSLAKRYRVVCIDLLGHGQSGCLGYIHTMELMAETVCAVLKQLKIRRSTLIGHSMGGYVALAYAEKYPDNVKGLCLANSTAQADSEERKLNRDRTIEAIKTNHKTFIRMAISNLFRPKNRKLYANEIKALKKEALKTPVQGVIAALEGMKIRIDREALLHFGPYKKMIIIGRKDPVLDYQTLYSQAKESCAEILVFPDGHMSFIENKDEFLKGLMHFIE
jgi:pimeloyl-ACP methyl ester carboxylesterase